MKITIETPNPGEEDEVVFRVANIDERLLQVINSLKTEKISLTGYLDDKIVKLNPKDVFYFESVDNKVFAYAGKDVYEIRKKLYEIEEEKLCVDYMRISKSMIINISKIVYVKPSLNGRFEARLRNDEKLIISRQYVNELKKRLDI